MTVYGKVVYFISAKIKYKIYVLKMNYKALANTQINSQLHMKDTLSEK